jgi:hypothetical protein
MTTPKRKKSLGAIMAGAGMGRKTQKKEKWKRFQKLCSRKPRKQGAMVRRQRASGFNNNRGPMSFCCRVQTLVMLANTIAYFSHCLTADLPHNVQQQQQQQQQQH